MALAVIELLLFSLQLKTIKKAWAAFGAIVTRVGGSSTTLFGECSIIVSSYESRRGVPGGLSTPVFEISWTISSLLESASCCWFLSNTLLTAEPTYCPRPTPLPCSLRTIKQWVVGRLNRKNFVWDSADLLTLTSRQLATLQNPEDKGGKDGPVPQLTYSRTFDSNPGIGYS
ncbi:hypothetical protein CFAM422_010434 [Trichoderma lentiforme]|uniref:Uncharacterized protein n=1 Tax=Trichoderma lentiforme TaxID=1567552 RepID=A0A9P4X5Y9_9HYPO|nr:hypothetical protein CFAM422_010434 [Trichoderma lentiforme]